LPRKGKADSMEATSSLRPRTGLIPASRFPQTPFAASHGTSGFTTCFKSLGKGLAPAYRSHIFLENVKSWVGFRQTPLSGG
jgi:hypothetical protein